MNHKNAFMEQGIGHNRLNCMAKCLRLAFGLIALMLIVSSGRAALTEVDMSIASDNTPDVCYWSISPFFSTNSVFLWYCGLPLVNPDRLNMSEMVDLVPGQSYRSRVSVASGSVCDAMLFVDVDDCYDVFVNGLNVTDGYPNWRDGYYLSLKPPRSALSASFYIKPTPDTIPIAKFQIIGSTGCPLKSAVSSGVYSVKNDGMSKAMGTAINTTYPVTFVMESGPVGSSMSGNMLNAGTNSGVIHIYAQCADPAPCLLRDYYFDINNGNCSCSAGGNGNCDTASVSQCVDLQFNLGRSAQGTQNAFLEVKSEVPSLTLGTPASLQCNFTRPELELITNSAGWLRQAKALDRLIDINTNTIYSYVMNFYHNSDLTGVDTNGFYTYTNAPFQTVFVLVSTNANQLEVIDSTQPAPIYYTWETNGWQMVTGNGLRYETKLTFTNDVYYTNVDTVADGTGHVTSQTIETWENFSYGARLLNRVTGTGPSALTESYTYSADGMILQANHTDGSWDIYTYDSLDRQTGDYSPFLNCAPTTNLALCRFTSRTYTNSVVSGSLDDGTDPNTPRMIVNYVQGTEVGRSYSVVSFGQEQDYQCGTAGAAWNASGNLETVTFTVTDAVNMGKPLYVIHPDLTMQVYEYDDSVTCPLPGSNSSFTKTTVWSGAPNTSTYTSVVDGTKDETWTDYLGNNVLHRVTDIASGTITEQEVNSYDALDHLTNTIYLNRTSLQQVYDCCNLQSQTGPDGTTTSYGYDLLKRRITTTLNGVTVSNILDAIGNVVGTVRFGTDGSVISNNISVYDTVGRLISSTDGLNNTTTYTNYLDVSNEMIQVTTFADASTRITTNAQDGTLLSVSGTAVLPVRYAYGVENDGTVPRLYKKEIKQNANNTDTSEWTKNYTDMFGRDYKTVYASASGSPASQSIFNSAGQLSEQVDPDGVTTLYGYNAKGQAAYTAVDMNTNGIMDLGGADRISYSVSDVVSNGYNLYVNRTQRYVWSTYGSAISNLVSTSESSVDGLQNWNIIWNSGVGVTNYSRTAYVPASGETITTGIAPDGSTTVSTVQNGRQLSVIQSDANGVPISQTVFGYDAQGRQNAVTDVRNGTTTSYFNNNNQVTGILTPSPDGVQAGQLTTNVLDSLGRVTRTILPDATSVTNIYFTDGLLQKTYGSRTYPVAYTYDYAGRMKTMTTWTNFAASSGAAMTTWNYDIYRGFMTNKAYADGHGPGYAYTAAGRLSTRTWARGTVTGYNYDNAGGLSSEGYSDGTAGTTNVYDRLGRQITVTNGTTVCNWTYDNLGNVLSQNYSGGLLNGLGLTNTYDSLFRRKGLSILNSPSSILASTTYGYDAASRLLKVSDGTNNAGYSYLANSPLVGNIAFQHNGQTVMTTAKQYDLLNRLSSISSVAGTNVFSFNYANNTANQRTSVTNADSSYWVYQYDNLGQVISAKKYWSGGTPVAGQQFTNEYDTIGNRQVAASGGDASGSNLRTANYSVNSLNEYTSRTVPGYATVLGSANSNATVTVNLQRAYRNGSYFQDELPVVNTSSAQWLATTNLAVLNNGTNADIVTTNTGSMLIPQTPESFLYDLDGNMTTNGRWTVLWDGENRATNFTSLATLPTAAKIKVDCAYDWQGRRIQKIVSTNNGTAYVTISTNRYLYDGWNLIGILDGGNNLQYSFQWGSDLSGSMQGAGGVGGLISMTVYSGSNAGTYDYAYDGNGNVVGLISANNSLMAAQYEYDDFGNVLRSTGALAVSNPFQYSTKYYDLETRLNYYGYRYYDAGAGRWLNRDAMEEQGGMNLYGFIFNMPTVGVDINGNQFFWMPQRPGQSYPGPINIPLPPSAYIPPWAKTLNVNLSEIWSGILAKISSSSLGDGVKISMSAKWGDVLEGGYEVEISGDVSTCVFKEDKSSGLMFSGSASVSGLGGVGAGAAATGDAGSTKSPTGSATICKECESNIKPIVGELSLTASATAGAYEGAVEYSLGKWDTSKGFQISREWPTASVSKGEGINAFVGLKLSGTTEGSYAWKAIKSDK